MAFTKGSIGSGSKSTKSSKRSPTLFLLFSHSSSAYVFHATTQSPEEICREKAAVCITADFGAHSPDFLKGIQTVCVSIETHLPAALSFLGEFRWNT
jgi:hypothetical protein